MGTILGRSFQSNKTDARNAALAIAVVDDGKSCRRFICGAALCSPAARGCLGIEHCIALNHHHHPLISLCHRHVYRMVYILRSQGQLQATRSDKDVHAIYGNRFN